jgi:hypothetical protein
MFYNKLPIFISQFKVLKLSAKKELLVHEEGLLAALSLPNDLEFNDENIGPSNSEGPALFRLQPHKATNILKKRQLLSQLVTALREQIPTVVNLKAPYMVREAMLDICNSKRRSQPIVCEGARTYLRLAGFFIIFYVFYAKFLILHILNSIFNIYLIFRKYSSKF